MNVIHEIGNVTAKLPGQNPSRTVHAVDRTPQDVSHLSSLIAKSSLNDIEDIGQDQRLLCATHPLMLVIICAQSGKNPSITIGSQSGHGMRDGRTGRSYCKVMAGWPWRYRSKSKVITRDTSSHVSDHLCLISKNPSRTDRVKRADTECGTDGRTDWRTDGVKPIFPQRLRCVWDINIIPCLISRANL